MGDRIEINDATGDVIDNSWIDATVRYLVSPRNAANVKTRLMRALLAKVQPHPEEFRFPKRGAR